jgi:hypothetical protein
MEKYSEAQDIEYLNQGTWSMDAYIDLAKELIDTLQIGDIRTLRIARPKSFKLMFFNTVKSCNSQCKYYIKTFEVKKECAKVMIGRVK